MDTAEEPWCSDLCGCSDCVYLHLICTGNISPPSPISVRQYGEHVLREATATTLALTTQERLVRWLRAAELGSQTTSNEESSRKQALLRHHGTRL